MALTIGKVAKAANVYVETLRYYERRGLVPKPPRSLPRQHSSGDRRVMMGISKRGSQHLRTLLVHGARAVVRTAVRKTDSRSMWVNELRQRRGYNRATVAVVNKNARVIWAVLMSGEPWWGPKMPDVAEEIQLFSCGYPARCSVRQCQARPTVLARYADSHGRPLRQRELCERHADWLKANRPNIHDLIRDGKRN
jgi:MerR family regulatory protein/Transposase IS116/IS110/IS902 family